MSFTLVTNDDGVDSLSLPLLAGALQRRGEVRVAAPAMERSWIGKAISRFGDVAVAEVTRDGVPMMSVAGYPADAVQLGVYQLFGEKAAMVVSGVNIGANFGSAYVVGSGTVGAAVEGAIAGLPAFAFSAVSVGNFREWARYMRTEESRPDWQRFADISVAIIDEVMASGFPAEVDVISVNMPAEATLETPRLVAHIADTRYGSLFQEHGSGIYRHDWLADTAITNGHAGSDIAAVEAGNIAVTAIKLASIGIDSPALKAVWPQ